jgi:hypothetical protein
MPSRSEVAPQGPQRAHSFGGRSDPTYGPTPQRPYGSLSHRRPPPPPPDRQEYDPWNPRNSQGALKTHTRDAPSASPARSEASNHTLVGSDFEEKPTVDTDAVTQASATAQEPSIPTLERSDSSFSRKRSYEAETDDKSRLQDDQSKRKRRSQVAAAYSRR